MLLREMLGQELRSTRRAQARTLREVAGEASMSLGYLSEIERGTKEASSEMLAVICGALGVSQAGLLRAVALRMEFAAAEAAGMTFATALDDPAVVALPLGGAAATNPEAA